MATDRSADFAREFLDSYLKLGLGSMTKSDVDALVMWLLDRHGIDGSGPLSPYSNQAISERLKTPVAKVKKLRYEAALKFGAAFTSIEDMAKVRLLHSLSSATFDLDNDKICIIIEDALVKNWLQGQLKQNGQIFDHPFNSEMIRVSSDSLLDVLSLVFKDSALQQFKKNFDGAKTIQDAKARKSTLVKLAKDFTSSAAKAAAKGLASAFLPVPGA